MCMSLCVATGSFCQGEKPADVRGLLAKSLFQTTHELGPRRLNLIMGCSEFNFISLETICSKLKLYMYVWKRDWFFHTLWILCAVLVVFIKNELKKYVSKRVHSSMTWVKTDHSALWNYYLLNFFFLRKIFTVKTFKAVWKAF